MALSLRAHHIFAAHSATLLGFTYLVALVTAMFLAIVLILAVYNLYFHPLRNFPGPKPWIAFPILYHVSSIRGLLDIDLCRYHTTYGEVVRFLPNEISFTTAQAWNDIYGHGHRQMPKPFRRTHGEPHNILISNDADHARFRKALSNAFSERALREQEPLLTVYVDLLIEKLRDISAAGSKTDMVRWYNFTTFDLIGDLSFGEPFNCLQESQMHYWVANVFHFLKTLPLVRVSLEYPLFFKFLCLFMPANVNNAQSEQWRLVREKVRKRINNTAQTDRKDFMDSMLKHNGDKDELSLDELVSNAHILIIAGSETTATLLSGVTYWLHRTPEVLEKVTKEIRDAFKDESENNFITASARLPYMLACLKEALRIYPPVPTILPRATLPGAPTMISGYEVPENVSAIDFPSRHVAAPSIC